MKRRFTPEMVGLSALDVARTLEEAGISRERAIVLGGSALALAGIRPATDIDLMVASADYQQMQQAMSTPNGHPLRLKAGAHHPFLETDTLRLPNAPLPFDITHPHDQRTHKPTPELDEEFLRHVANFDKTHGFAYLPPELVADRKAAIGRRKDRRDIRLIRQVLRERGE